MAWKIGIPRLPSMMGWVLIGLVVLNIFALYVPRLLQPVPYSSVAVTRSEIIGNNLFVTANFIKTDCTFVRLTVVGFAGGETDILPWRDDDGLSDDFDRELGTQTLNIVASTRSISYDWFEIRTRHDCDGEIVDKVFAHIEGDLT
jgi:hypothetical protein